MNLFPRLNLKLIIPAIVFMALLVFAEKTQAATFYVSPTGSGSAACTSAAAACTFSRAQTVASNGDTIMVGGGIYLNQKWTITKSVILRAADGATPIISCPAYDVGNYGAAIEITAANATIDGITIQNIGYTSSGGRPAYNSQEAVKVMNTSGAKILNCKSNNIWGNAVRIEDSDDVIVDNFEADLSVTCKPAGVCSNSWGGSFQVVGSSDGNIIKNSITKRSYGEGFQVIRGASNNTVENSMAIDTNNPGFYTHTAHNTVFRNNIAYRTQISDFIAEHAGIMVGAEDDSGCSTSNYGHRIYGNMISGYPRGLAIAYMNNTTAGCNLTDTLFSITVSWSQPAGATRYI